MKVYKMFGISLMHLRKIDVSGIYKKKEGYHIRLNHTLDIL